MKKRRKRTLVETMEETEMPAISAFKRFLDERDLSVGAFARQHGMDSSDLSKLIRGQKQKVSVDLAAAIQDATNGSVYWRLWIRVPKHEGLRPGK